MKAAAGRGVAVVGSGPVGTAVAWSLARRGVQVEVFEKGPPYPYPHAEPFERRYRYRAPGPLYPPLPADVVYVEQSGDYPRRVQEELDFVVGGSGVRWEALTPRMPAADFATRSRYGFGRDWPLSYADLEPWYGHAEALLGVAGTDADNPFAPPRSTPYPLPPFELSWDDRRLAERLAGGGLQVHTTPQARTRHAYDGRPACVDFNACAVCPIGARYSPHLHLRRAEATGRCRVHSGSVVRRVLVDRAGRARGLLVHDLAQGAEREHPAGAVVVAAGAIESARLLLLSTDERWPDGLANRGGRLGEGLTFHHLWTGRLHFRRQLWPGRPGPWTAQSLQFADPPSRGRHGGVKVELSSRLAHATFEPIQAWPPPGPLLDAAATAADVRHALRPRLHWRPIVFHGETAPGPGKRVVLAARRDRFGDPVARVHYSQDDFDLATHAFARDLFGRFRDAAGADDSELVAAEDYYSGFHQMGTCAMAARESEGVADAVGRAWGVPGLWITGGSTFPGSGTVNPTLTMVALALRTAERIAAEVAPDMP
jgi:glucose dehydrogenase